MMSDSIGAWSVLRLFLSGMPGILRGRRLKSDNGTPLGGLL
jgi:hypothetical protein